ncbi:hypothetical protein [Priestia abyssalis]|uniref:hypothetical protein n=1 Tax=Priestia abyssalis TaxID=1221450 RepID=UPI00099565BE|nr:hypothetical protein [Priestia abyssalis]
MKSLISLIIFTLPGLLAYFWINLFGLTPTSKRDNSEVVAISALLWIPIVSIVLFIYQTLAWVSNWKTIDPSFDVPLLKKDWMLISSKVTDINKLSENIWFLLFYVVLSIITSFYVAQFISNTGYKIMLAKVNRVRERNGIAPFSEKTTVWNEMFLNNAGQIVEYTKVEDPNFRLIGCLTKVPRAHEPDKGIVLEATDHWANVMEYYNVEIDNVFIDTSNGSIIKIYNTEQALEAQDLYNERVNNGSIS